MRPRTRWFVLLLSTCSPWACHSPLRVAVDGGMASGGSGGTPQGTEPTAAPVDPPVSEPYWLAAGDFNGDGTLDVVTLNQGASDLSVLLGKGDGTFRARKDQVVGMEHGPILVGDWNGDGKLDLATANNSVSTLLGDGKGGFTLKSSNESLGLDPHGWQFPGFTAADLDDDGALDLAVGSCWGTVVLLYGNGDGTFITSATQYPNDREHAGCVGAIAAADMNGDHRADLAFAGSEVSLLVGTGKRKFNRTTVADTDGHGGSALASVDWNGDGKPDLAVVEAGDGADDPSQLRIVFGTAPGASPSFGATNYAPSSRIVAQADGSGSDLATGDLNGDRTGDVVWTQHVGGDCFVSVLLGQKDGTLARQVDLPPDERSCAAFVLGDFDGDGRLDQARLADRERWVDIWSGKGDGSFRPPR